MLIARKLIRVAAKVATPLCVALPLLALSELGLGRLGLGSFMCILVSAAALWVWDPTHRWGAD